MKKLITILIVLILIAAAGMGYYTFEYAKKMQPNDEVISKSELFNVSGDQVAIMYNHSLQDPVGYYQDGQIYLPLTWTRENLNPRFYWDSSVEKLFYVLPTEIRTTDLTGRSAQGQPELLRKNNDLYLSLSLVTAYSDIAATAFTNDEAKRVFIEDTWTSFETASLTDDLMLRTGRSIKQRGIIPLDKGARVRILRDYELDPDPNAPSADSDDSEADDEPWCRVRTEEGFTGYVPKKKLSSYDAVQPKSSFAAPEYTHISLGEPVVLGWHQVSNMESNQSLNTLIKNAAPLNVISPTWFSLTDNSGNMDNFISDEYIAAAHEQGLQVWALIDNFNENVNSTELLSNATARSNVISQLIASVTEHGIDGINIDFEQIKPEASEAFIEFLRELSVSCRNHHIVLSVDDPNATLGNIYYNRRAQAECVDYIINMGYDEHYAGGDAGSVSSFPFFKNGIDLSLAEVPADRFIAGLPFYTRIWQEEDGKTTSSSVGLGAAQQWIQDNAVALTWDNELGQYVGFSEAGNIWLEDRESLTLKMDYIREQNLGGVAGWRLGLETPETWETIQF